MSVQVMAWVWAHSRSEPTERLVLLAIADCANDAGAEAYPSLATLAAKTGLHGRSVQRCLGRLVAIGELVVSPNAGPHGCNRYRVTMTPGTAPPPAQRHPRQTDTPAQRHTTPGTAPPHPRHSAVSTPGTAPPEPSLNHPRTIREPSVAQQIVAEWIERCPKRPPERVIGPMAKHIAALLAEDIDPDDIRRGIAAWMAKPDAHPSILPSVVNGVMNGARASPKATSDQRARDALAAGARVQAKLSAAKEITG